MIDLFKQFIKMRNVVDGNRFTNLLYREIRTLQKGHRVGNFLLIEIIGHGHSNILFELPTNVRLIKRNAFYDFWNGKGEVGRGLKATNQSVNPLGVVCNGLQMMLYNNIQQE